MNIPQDNPAEMEDITFEPSELLEKVIIDFGKILCNPLIEATRVDELEALNELIGMFTELASAYGEQTDRIREDLGVSLNEAALMKLHAVKQGTGSNEWRYYAEQTKEMLDEFKS
jgi:hypothetical protein